MSKKPKWVVEKEQAKRAAAAETVWLFGLHAVRDALLNPKREKLRLMVTLNAQAKLADAIEASGIEAEVIDPRKFNPPIDPQSVHQGAALEVKPLNWGGLAENCIGAEVPRVLLLDRVTDPHNVGAILRSAAAFDACAIVTQDRHAPPESGSLAKSASGALEIVPWVRVVNLARALEEIAEAGYWRIGLAGEAEATLAEALPSGPVALVLGAEGEGMRHNIVQHCDALARLPISEAMESLNVSNAAAIALYATTTRDKD